MKKLFTLMSFIFLTVTICAQAPQKMSYQAVIRNGTALVTSTSVPMDINIWRDAVTSGTLVYTESQTPSTNTNGVVSIEIGGGTGFDTISWTGGSYFIETITDLTGIGGGTVTGSSQLLSVPYALHAKNGFTRYIGELYGGGIIVAVWNVSGVEHGLIASLTDLSTASAYSDVSALIGATGQSPVDGQANTTAMLTQSATAPAAMLCADFTSGSYDDWYLPAAWELNLCYNAAFMVNTILGAGGFNINVNYWSSSEAAGSGVNAHFLNFTTGYFNYGAKSNTGIVRAVRRF